jgi:hypothetical protein
MDHGPSVSPTAARCLSHSLGKRIGQVVTSWIEKRLGLANDCDSQAQKAILSNQFKSGAHDTMNPPRPLAQNPAISDALGELENAA